MNPREILIKAAEDLAEKGHCKGSFFKPMQPGEMRYASEERPACALGALSRAGKLQLDRIEQHPAAQLLADHIQERFPALIPDLTAPYDIITEFNDSNETTGEDVILAMKEAAHRG